MSRFISSSFSIREWQVSQMSTKSRTLINQSYLTTTTTNNDQEKLNLRHIFSSHTRPPKLSYLFSPFLQLHSSLNFFCVSLVETENMTLFSTTCFSCDWWWFGFSFYLTIRRLQYSFRVCICVLLCSLLTRNFNIHNVILK